MDYLSYPRRLLLYVLSNTATMNFRSKLYKGLCAIALIFGVWAGVIIWLHYDPSQSQFTGVYVQEIVSFDVPCCVSVECFEYTYDDDLLIRRSTYTVLESGGWHVYPLGSMGTHSICHAPRRLPGRETNVDNMLHDGRHSHALLYRHHYLPI